MKIGQCENAARSVTEACLGNHGHCIAGSVTIDVASKLLTTVLVLATYLTHYLAPSSDANISRVDTDAPSS